jgi:hypothetical protein
MKRLILLVVAAIACGEPEPETFDPCMPNAQNKTLRLYGPWGGLQDHETDTTSVDFARSFNVEVDGREIRSRRGRVPYASSSVLARCGQAVHHTLDATSYPYGVAYDTTATLSDGDNRTTIAFVTEMTRASLSGSATLMIGAPFKFGKIDLKFAVPNTNLRPGVELKVQYYTGAGYPVATLSADGTVKMSADGTVTFVAGDDWIRGLSIAGFVPVSGGDYNQDLYWVLVSLKASNPSIAEDVPSLTEIAEVGIDAEAALQPSGAMTGFGDGSFLYGGSGWISTVGGAVNSRWVALSGGGPWSWARWGSDMIGAGGGSPVALNGASTSILKAVPGIDKDTTGYLSSLPNAQALAVYRGRLYLAHGKTVIFSELNNALNIIPYDGSAPQRGANVWPASNNFDASGEIAGFAVFGDRLVIATDVGLDVWDGHSRQSVPGAPGCVAGHTIAETRKGLAYLALDGVYLFNGASARHISGGVSETLERVSKNAVHGAVGVAYPAARQYRLYVPVNGSARNTLCLAWNYEDDRWFPLGGTPPWLDADERYREMEVAAACVANVGADGEVLLTADYDGNVWVEDRGFTDGGYTVSWVIAFKRLGLGEDEGMRTWRNVRISAKATGAPIKLAMLPDGDDLEMSILSGAETGMPVSTTALTGGQATWMTDVTVPEPLPDGLAIDLEGAVLRDDSSISGPTAVWRSFPVPHARVTRTIQPVLYCDGVDSTGARRGTKAAVRGIEVDYRIRTGRRSLA